MSNSRRTLRRAKSDAGIVLTAALITVTQLALFMRVAPGRSWRERYESAFQWDSGWYADIARRGYVSTIPPVSNGKLSNVTHFPGYPLAIRVFHWASHENYRISALIVAQLCACGFWVYVLLFFRRWRITLMDQAAAVAAIGAHPMAFFMVVGFSEPMFLMALIGFWYWFVRQGGNASILSAAHGLAACATRLAGAACVFSPFSCLIAAGSRRLRVGIARACVVTATSLLGVFLFFAYCYARFGIWNLYQVRQAMGWGHRFDVLAFFYPSAYGFIVPQWHDETSLGVFLNPFALVATVALLVLAARRGHKEARHFALSALGILYVTIAGIYHSHFPAMARYQFQIHAMLVPGYVHVFGTRLAERPTDAPPTSAPGLAAAAGGIAAGLLLWKSLDLQLYFASVFSRGGPVL